MKKVPERYARLTAMVLARAFTLKIYSEGADSPPENALITYDPHFRRFDFTWKEQSTELEEAAQPTGSKVADWLYSPAGSLATILAMSLPALILGIWAFLFLVTVFVPLAWYMRKGAREDRSRREVPTSKTVSMWPRFSCGTIPRGFLTREDLEPREILAQAAAADPLAAWEATSVLQKRGTTTMEARERAALLLVRLHNQNIDNVNQQAALEGASDMGRLSLYEDRSL